MRIWFGAVESGPISKVEELLRAGWPVDFRGWTGMTGLSAAVGLGREEMCKLLLDSGASAGLKCYGMLSPLMRAIGDEKCVNLLIRADAPVDDASHQGRTALMMAADHGCASDARLLIQAGASLERVDHMGMRAAEHAARHGKADVLAELLRGGAELVTKQGVDLAGACATVECRDVLIQEVARRQALRERAEMDTCVGAAREGSRRSASL